MPIYNITPSQQQLLQTMVKLAKDSGTDMFCYDPLLGGRCASFFTTAEKGPRMVVKCEPADVNALVVAGLVSGTTQSDGDFSGIVLAGTVTPSAYKAVQTNFRGTWTDRVNAKVERWHKLLQLLITILASVAASLLSVAGLLWGTGVLRPGVWSAPSVTPSTTRPATIPHNH